MKSKKTTTTPAEKASTVKKATSLFDKENKLWMLGGIATMIIGFLLMAGGRSEDPNVFNVNEVYSTTRITVAPILILAGLVILIFSIFRQPKRR